MGLMGLIGLMGPIGLIGLIRLIGLMGPIRDSWALLVQLAKKKAAPFGTAFIRYSEKMVAC
jgi:hypothetical protein